MLVAQSVIDTLAGRIERAYRVRRLGWHGVCSTPRVWAMAAETLLKLREEDDSLPLDPELYVAAQPCDTSFVNPWSDLTGAEAVARYRQRVTEIVRRLRDELAGEIHHAEERIEQGQSVIKILTTRTRRLSPLGRYIMAYRAGRPSLASRFLQGALEQHRACPLYRQASTVFLPEGIYPTTESRTSPSELSTVSRVRSKGQFHRN